MVVAKKGRRNASKLDKKHAEELAYTIDYCDGDMEEEVELSRVRLFDGDDGQWDAFSGVNEPVAEARAASKGSKKRGRFDEKFADLLDRSVFKEFNDVMYKGTVVSVRKFSGNVLFKVLL
jgi:hypothetical protein